METDNYDWDKAMAEYRRKKKAGLLDKKEAEVLDRKVDDNRNKPLSLKEVDWDSVCAATMADLVISAIASAVMCYILYPIVHIFFLCDDFFCSHDLTPDFITFLLVTIGIAVVLGLLINTANKTAPNNQVRRKPRRRTRQYYGDDDLETDYYDSDMEGAPGYYGGD